MTTVSRMLSGQTGKYRISEETAKAILDYARKENFTPNPIAKRLRLRKASSSGHCVWHSEQFGHDSNTISE